MSRTMQDIVLWVLAVGFATLSIALVIVNGRLIKANKNLLGENEELTRKLDSVLWIERERTKKQIRAADARVAADEAAKRIKKIVVDPSLESETIEYEPQSSAEVSD